VKEGVLVLTGRVSSYCHKRLAQNLALDRAAGPIAQGNELHVEP
jgi:hypothetical protein